MNPQADRAGRWTVQCSTGSLAPLAGGRYWNVRETLEGVRILGWPAIELRLWQEWDEGDLVEVAGRMKGTGVEVGSVHIPPESEQLLSTPGHEREAMRLMGKCLAAALAAGAKVAVVHAWDLRRPGFDQGVLASSLNSFARVFGSQGVKLSVECIPGHTKMFPILSSLCPDITFTADTRWAALESSWDLLSGFVPRISNVHVQTYVDPTPEGGVRLGRIVAESGAAGAKPGPCGVFDAERVIRRFACDGYAGLVTLEPNGVPGVGGTHLRQALETLGRWEEAMMDASKFNGR